MNFATVQTYMYIVIPQKYPVSLGETDGTIMIGILEDDFLYLLSFVDECFTVGQ